MTQKTLTHKQLIALKPSKVVACTDGEVRLVLEHGGIESFTVSSTPNLFSACRAEHIEFELQHPADFHRGIAAPKGFGERMVAAAKGELGPDLARFAQAIERMNKVPKREATDAELRHALRVADGLETDAWAHGSINDGQFGH